MRWVVLGNRGMFGSELESLLRDLGSTVNGYNRSNLDLASAVSDLARALDGADVVVNAVAYTAVDLAESNQEQATLINGEYAGKLASASAAIGARFIQISTDYVFDGNKSTPYLTTDLPNPVTAYGKSKLIGEQLVADSGADYAILRTAWLYGQNGKCFPKTIARILGERGQASVVSDQHGQPTWTLDLAEQVIQVAAMEQMPRLVHSVSSGSATWADFASEVALSIGMDPAEVICRVTSAEFPTLATRPAWSVLENAAPGVTPIADWRDRWREASEKVLNRS